MVTTTVISGYTVDENPWSEKIKYTNDFVVEIRGNRTAQSIAHQFGYKLIQEIIPNHFHFKVKSLLTKCENEKP